MYRKVAYFTLFLTLVAMFSFGQESAFMFRAGNHGANLQLPAGLTDNFKTISFWVRPDETWDSTYLGPEPLIVKDKYGFTSNWGGRFRIYIEEGRIKWNMASYLNPDGSTIQSDRNFWKQGVWYHLAFTIEDGVGSKMYVNGIQQADTSAWDILPPPPNEGPDERFFVGTWGSNNTGQTRATIDELRFWNDTRTVEQIREKMCVRTQCWSSLRGGYDFNLSTSGGYQDVCGNHHTYGNATLTGPHIVESHAPVGAKSAYLYASDWTGQKLTFTPRRDTLILSDIRLPGNEGIHIYYYAGMPENDTGIPDTVVSVDGVFGVWSSDTTGMWDARFSWRNRRGVNSSVDCDECGFLLSRDVYLEPWTLLPKNPNNCGFNLNDESRHARVWREEYFMIDLLTFNPGLPDTAKICSNDVGNLSARWMPDATYTWSDGRTGITRTVLNSGMYWVAMDYHGCTKYDTCFVELDTIPEFSWQNDTTICKGDTITLTCPISDGVTYSWDTGDTTRSIDVWRKGVYILTVNDGRCSYYNYVTVKVIPSLSVELGPRDSLMCLGQDIEWDLYQNVGDYLWWDGSTDHDNRVFNMPGTYWVTLENECFWVSDTITLEFVDCDCRIDIPNAFTPNQDLVNESTGVFTRCYFQYYEFEIIDRWGNRVFYSDDPHARWDGTYAGSPSPMGMYVYRLSYRRWTGPKEPVVQRGTMMLIR